MLLEKVGIHLFSSWLGMNRRVDWVLKPCMVTSLEEGKP